MKASDFEEPIEYNDARFNFDETEEEGITPAVEEEVEMDIPRDLYDEYAF
jgi:hypothetical protein